MTIACQNYYRLTIKLCALIRAGKIDTDEAEIVRKHMDFFWLDMTRQEKVDHTFNATKRDIDWMKVDPNEFG